MTPTFLRLSESFADVETSSHRSYADLKHFLALSLPNKPGQPSTSRLSFRFTLTFAAADTRSMKSTPLR